MIKQIDGQIDCGEPAFPVNESATRSDGTEYLAAQHMGISIRDYFAAKALPTILGDWTKGEDGLAPDSDSAIPHHGGITYRQRRKEQLSRIATDAYAVADAMIAAGRAEKANL